ncbi:MAG: hypothetical protein H0X30_24170 [Anaerolineae bacterium]|nr:hypothetical protein [Anaerolineae bacterium]
MFYNELGFLHALGIETCHLQLLLQQTLQRHNFLPLLQIKIAFNDITDTDDYDDISDIKCTMKMKNVKKFMNEENVLERQFSIATTASFDRQDSGTAEKDLLNLKNPTNFPNHLGCGC